MLILASLALPVIFGETTTLMTALPLPEVFGAAGST